MKKKSLNKPKIATSELFHRTYSNNTSIICFQNSRKFGYDNLVLVKARIMSTNTIGIGVGLINLAAKPSLKMVRECWADSGKKVTLLVILSFTWHI